MECILTEFCCAYDLDSSSFIHEFKKCGNLSELRTETRGIRREKACRLFCEQYIPIFYSRRLYRK